MEDKRKRRRINSLTNLHRMVPEMGTGAGSSVRLSLLAHSPHLTANRSNERSATSTNWAGSEQRTRPHSWRSEMRFDSDGFSIPDTDLELMTPAPNIMVALLIRHPQNSSLSPTLCIEVKHQQSRSQILLPGVFQATHSRSRQTDLQHFQLVYSMPSPAPTARQH